MIIYSQHFFRRRTRSIPSPSCLPLVIIMTLLLGIVVAFMPPVISGVNVDLPTLNTEPIEIYDDFVYTTIYVVSDDEVVVNNYPAKIESDGDLVKEINKNQKLEDVKIFVRADIQTSYNAIMRVLEKMNDIGIKDISLVGKYSGEKKF